MFSRQIIPYRVYILITINNKEFLGEDSDAISTRLAMRCVCLHLRAHACKRASEHARARANTAESESPTRYALYALTQRALRIHAPTSCARAIVYDECARRANATCVNVQDLVQHLRTMRVQCTERNSASFYIRYTGAARLYLLAIAIALDQSRFRKREEWSFYKDISFIKY